jgi:hypothetical protein
MIVLCLAGPYRDPRGDAYVHRNIQAAREVAEQLWAEGFAVLCPHLNTAFMSGICDEEYFLRGAQEFVRRSDAIVMLPGWRNSEGALAEVGLALELGIPDYYFQGVGFWTKLREWKQSLEVAVQTL